MLWNVCMKFVYLFRDAHYTKGKFNITFFTLTFIIEGAITEVSQFTVQMK